jgi:xanthine dehydrogenase accessory factor
MCWFCGGLEVYLTVNNIFEEIVKAQKAKRDFAVATVVKAEGSAPRRDTAKMLVFSDGSSIGTVGGGVLEARIIRDAREAIKKGESRLVRYGLDEQKESGLPMMCGGDVEIFIEAYKARPQLIIAGAGHVGKALSAMGAVLGFGITVIDDRKEWANKDRFPEAEEVIVTADMTKGLEDCNISEDTYIVIATRGHNHDKEALKGALKRNARYVGMIGSPNKVKEVFNQLVKEGIDRGTLEKVHAPIGLDLGGQTPEEIALSILAEILMVKNNATGKPLCFRRDEI